MSLLVAEGLVGGYGGMDILNGVGLSVRADEIAVIVGPNGAGKSTAMKAIFGLVRLREGRVLLAGAEITNFAPVELVKRGMAYVPQERNVFRNLSVRENLEMGAYLKPSETGRMIEQVFGLFPALKEKARQAAGELSGGQRQMVAIGRALMLQPRALLLDEPTAGLSPRYMAETFTLVRQVNALGVAILMVEQNARQALAVAHRAYLLVAGRLRREGSGADFLADERLAEELIAG